MDGGGRTLSTALHTTHPPVHTLLYSVFAVLSLLVQEHARPGVAVFVQTSADFCFASGSEGHEEREREKEMTKQRGSKVIHLKLETGAGYECFAVLEWTSAPSLLCSDVSLSFRSCRGQAWSRNDHHHRTTSTSLFPGSYSLGLGLWTQPAHEKETIYWLPACYF